MSSDFNVVSIAQRLIQLPSLTPYDKGCLEYVTSLLTPLGFECHRLDRGNTSNLYAKLDRGGKNICFAGHTDVVPVIDEKAWDSPPFAGHVNNGKLYGRGAVDMKGAIAAYIAAVPEIIKKHPQHSFSFLLTSDEEGDGYDGTVYALEELAKKKEKIDLCLVGEPTSVNELGDTLLIGRRGSLNGVITINGCAGHVAYPQNAQNPIPPMLEFLKSILSPLDQGHGLFEPSNLEITSIDVGNPTCNIIPPSIQARFNIRFNPSYTKTALEEWLYEKVESLTLHYDLSMKVSGEAFMGMTEEQAAPLRQQIEEITGKKVTLSTRGGISDARFIKNVCPVFELGLKDTMAHQIDEYTSLADLEELTRIYASLFDKFLKTA